MFCYFFAFSRQESIDNNSLESVSLENKLEGIHSLLRAQVEHARQETAGSNEIPVISWQQYSDEWIQWPELFGFSGNRQEPATTGNCIRSLGSLHRMLNIFRRGSRQILYISSRFSWEMHGNTAAREH